MASRYSGRYTHPLGAGADAFGGAARGFPVEVLRGETNLVTSFEPFTNVIANSTVLVNSGWSHNSTAGVGAANATTLTSANTAAGLFDIGALRVLGSTVADEFYNLQHDTPGNVDAAAASAPLVGQRHFVGWFGAGVNETHMWAARISLLPSTVPFVSGVAFGLAVADGSITTNIAGGITTANWGTNGFLFNLAADRTLDFGVRHTGNPIWASTGTTTRTGVATISSTADTFTASFAFRVQTNLEATSNTITAYWSNGSTGVWRQFGRTIQIASPYPGAAMVTHFEARNGTAQFVDSFIHWIAQAQTG